MKYVKNKSIYHLITYQITNHCVSIKTVLDSPQFGSTFFLKKGADVAILSSRSLSEGIK